MAEWWEYAGAYAISPAGGLAWAAYDALSDDEEEDEEDDDEEEVEAPILACGPGAPGGGACNSGVYARAKRRPTEDEYWQIVDALNNNPQLAIELALRYYDIDRANLNGIPQFDPNFGFDGECAVNGTVRIGNTAVESVEELTSTLVHESTHANQGAALLAQTPGLPGFPLDDTDYRETQAYDSEVASAPVTDVDDDQEAWDLVQNDRDKHYNNLSPDEQESFRNGEVHNQP